MLTNLAGPSFDFENVLFAVLQECEHHRRGLPPGEEEERLAGIARDKLAEIRESYAEGGGTEPYWRDLEKEVLQTALPQYAPAAAEQNRLERNGYDVWRQGDPLARTAFAVIGLALGGLLIAAPFIPLWENTVAFALAAGGFLYPEIRKAVFDYRHSRLLNRLIAEADRYQHNPRLHYVSQARMDEEFAALASPEPARRERPRLVREEASPEPPQEENSA
jgi:hypothetical protein